MSHSPSYLLHPEELLKTGIEYVFKTGFCELFLIISYELKNGKYVQAV